MPINTDYPENLNPCGSAWNPVLPPSANPETYCSPSPYYDIDNKRILGGLMNAVDPMMRSQLQLCGTTRFFTTAQQNFNFMGVLMLEDSVIDTTANTIATGTDLTPLAGKTIKAGTVIFAPFTKFKLVSGLAQGYYDPFRP